MEVEFVQGVRMNPEVAASVGELAATKNIALTAHGPYFVNLNAVEPQKVHMSKERILQTARIAALFGARSITFHAAFYLKNTPAETYATVKKHLQQVVGTIEEILQLSSEIEGVAPCIDFSHWHARTGKANSYQEFSDILDRVERKLGRQALDNMHIHISGIAYGNKGEIKHLMLPESDFQYEQLLKALNRMLCSCNRPTGSSFNTEVSLPGSLKELPPG